MAKKRDFEIDFDDDAAPSVPTGKSERRGPMAAAIVEASSALEDRAAAEAAIREENDRLAHELVELKKAGLVMARVPVAKVRTDKLLRDRVDRRDGDLDDLKRSIREVGLANAIRVEEVDGGYELVQGFRRLSAFAELYDETGDEAFAYIPAGIYARNEGLTLLYRRMVDENLVRKNVSFGEMAALAWGYVRSPTTDVQSAEAAVDQLYASAGPQKRSYIKVFTRVLRELEGALTHVEAIPRALGIEIARRLSDQPRSVDGLRAKLTQVQGQGAAAEVAVLRDYIKAPKAKPKPKQSARTTLKLTSPKGLVRVTATNGAVTIKSDVDFSEISKDDLEAAIAAFWASLDSER